MAVVIYQKKYTETLSAMLERFIVTYPQFAESTMTYAGRLDPLAEGLMIILTDEDVHRKDEFLGLKKKYEVEYMLGVSTDSYDILGLPCTHDVGKIAHVEDKLLKLKKIKLLPYPVFSSRKVKGKPLFYWYKQGRINDIEIPSQNIQVYSAEHISISNASLGNIINTLTNTIASVQGDFRQKKILDQWEKITPHTEIYIARASFHVSSGTYVRSLVHELGVNLDCGACCIRIKRTEIGGRKDEGILLDI